jgi:hypothetical protein
VRRMVLSAALVFLLFSEGLFGQSREREFQGPRSGLSTEQRAHLFDGDFAILNGVAALPEPIRNALAYREKKLDMANPGQRFNAGDVVTGLPTRRLVFAGVSGERCFVYFEQGGIVSSVQLAVFRIVQSGSTQNAVEIWQGSDQSSPARDLAELRNRLSGDRFYCNNLWLAGDGKMACGGNPGND